MPWQHWPPQPKNPPWAHGWHNYYEINPKYPQFQKYYLHFTPQYYPPQPKKSPQFHAQQPNQKLPLPSTPFPKKSNQLPTQPLPNPSNENQQVVYNIEGQKFQYCMIAPLGLSDVQM